MTPWSWASAVLTILGCMLVSSLAAQPTVATPVGPRAEQKPLLSIGLVADAQYCDCDASQDRYYRISLEKMHQAVDTINARGVDLVVNLGDLIDQKLASFPVVKRELARFQAPVINVLGNHEFWDVPNPLQQSVLDSINLSQGYCEIQLPSLRLLFLDGTELAEYAQGAHREHTEEAEACRGSLKGHTNSALWNGAIGLTQMAWIDYQLSEADRAGERAILFCHFPIAPAGHPMSLWNEADLRVLLDKHASVEAWVSGHAHGGLYTQLDAVHHLTLQGMLMTPDSNSFAILNVYSDRLVVEGFGREPARVLPLRGSEATAATILPERLERPDATPPPASDDKPNCIERTIVSPMGKLVFSEETDSLGLQNLPLLPPGIYEILERDELQLEHRRLVVLPR